jgi:hypothetical protein
MSNLDAVIPFQACRAIPVVRVGVPAVQVISLSNLVRHADQIVDIMAPPLTRLALLRWLLLCDAVKPLSPHGMPTSCRLYGRHMFPDLFDTGALQCSEALPVASARSSRDILELRDGNNMALDPTPEPEPTPEQDILALITAYFCDRPGLKARAAGLPISGQCPVHMGRTTVFRAWDNLAEFVERNRVDGMADYLGHRWRRLQFVAKGRLVIAAGDEWTDMEFRDPWVLGKSHPNHVGRTITAEMVADEKRAGAFVQGLKIGDAIDTTGIALQQASPLAIWTQRGEVVAADT